MVARFTELKCPWQLSAVVLLCAKLYRISTVKFFCCAFFATDCRLNMRENSRTLLLTTITRAGTNYRNSVATNTNRARLYVLPYLVVFPTKVIVSAFLPIILMARREDRNTCRPVWCFKMEAGEHCILWLNGRTTAQITHRIGVSK